MSRYTIEDIQRMYSNEDYDVLIEAASQLFSDNPNKDSAIFFIIAIISSMGFSNNEMELLLKSVKSTTPYFDSIEEYRYAIREWYTALSKRLRKLTNIYIQTVLNDPSIENWRTVISLIVDATKLSFNIQLEVLMSADYQEKLSKEGLDKEKAKELYPIGTFETSGFYDEILKGALDLKDIIRDKIEEGIGGSPDVAKRQGLRLMHELAIGELMFTHVADSKDCSSDLKEKCLKEAIDIKVLELVTVIHPKGYDLSIYSDQQQRNQITDKLNSYIRELKKLNPSISLQEKEYTAPIDTLPKGACYVATAVYGSYDCPEVWTLRRYRDYSLYKTWYGRSFIRIYYSFSPHIIQMFGDKKWFQRICRKKLDQTVLNLQKKGFENTPYNDIEW